VCIVNIRIVAAMDDEAIVRGIANAFFDSETRQNHVHTNCVFLEVDSDGNIKTEQRIGNFDRGRVVSVVVLHDGLTAVAHINNGHQAGFLTLLKAASTQVNSIQWFIISAVLSLTQQSTDAIKPPDVNKVMTACWDEYCGASRACDGKKMASIFHPVCRLTFSTNTGELTIKSQEEFCDRVEMRYTSDAHSPYKHLQRDPRVKEGDSLMGVDFGTPSLAMVTLKVGHPPFLWTDVLTCAFLKIGNTKGGEKKWWIVAKSSSNEPFLTDLAM